MKPAPFICPHCGQKLAPSVGAYHAATCVHAPDAAQRVRAALEDPDNPGVALSVRAYEARADQYSVARKERLIRTWGPTWADVARHLGLQPGQHAGTKKGTHTRAQREGAEARAIAETEEALARDAELRAYYDGGRGFEACRVRTLPDGRTAWMLR